MGSTDCTGCHQNCLFERETAISKNLRHLIPNKSYKIKMCNSKQVQVMIIYLYAYSRTKEDNMSLTILKSIKTKRLPKSAIEMRF